MNKELLLKTADAIEQNPEHFDMERWAGINCGTTACIAGWVVFLGRKRKRFDQFARQFNSDDEVIPNEAAKRLGLVWTTHSFTLADSLFLVDKWKNQELKESYKAAETHEEKAKAAADYVRWFVQEYGDKN